MEDRIMVGFTEKVKVFNCDGSKHKTVKARIDTGATMSSIDTHLAAHLNLGPIVRIKKVKSSLGEEIRPVVKVSLILQGKKVRGNFSIADRAHMKYDMLIGQRILKMGFLVDPQKK